ncbi:MAG: TetR/AcrR family transcriptional regulator [Ardenticatenaceae bacterium]|nr:TetR/AcrR family transcriptional regulator [Ardenticatenaceae bacterium]
MPKIVSDEVIFQAVVKTLVTHGYAGSTMKEIAELAGVNEATLFRKYESKEKLIVQAISTRIKQVDLDSSIFYTGDIRADLLRCLNRIFENNQRTGQMFLFLTSEIARFPELQPAVEPLNQSMMTLGQLLARYQAEGVLRPEHPLHAVGALVGPIVVARNLSLTNLNLYLPAFDLQNHVENYLTGRCLASSTD